MHRRARMLLLLLLLLPLLLMVLMTRVLKMFGCGAAPPGTLPRHCRLTVSIQFLVTVLCLPYPTQVRAAVGHCAAVWRDGDQDAARQAHERRHRGAAGRLIAISCHLYLQALPLHCCLCFCGRLYQRHDPAQSMGRSC